MAKTKFGRGLKKFWKNLSLKTRLAGIWFLKNLVTFLELALIVIVILIVSGAITENSPFFGKVEPFKSLVYGIRNALAGASDVTSVFGIITSVGVVVGSFLLKVRTISQADIKSDNLKLALITAGLYFNEEGRLVKKIEKSSGRDLNKDGKIDDQELTKEEKKEMKTRGVIGRTVSAIKEFFIIMGTDFSDNEEENDKIYKKVVEKNNLMKAEEAQKEIKELITDSSEALKNKKIEEYTAAEAAKVEESKDDSEGEVIKTKKSFKLFSLFKKKEKPEVSEEPTTVETKPDVIEPVEEDTVEKRHIIKEKIAKFSEKLREHKKARIEKKMAKVAAKLEKEKGEIESLKKEKVEKIEKKVETEIKPAVKTEVKKVEKKVDSSIEDFLSKIRNSKK